MRIFGYMRFSYLGQSDVKIIGKVGLEGLGEVLFEERRMAQRFHLFEHLCLPSIKAQKDPIFKLFIAASLAMPEKFKTKLMDLTSDIPQIEVVFDNKPNVIDVFHPLQEAVSASIDGSTIHFRLDDDDALSHHIIKKLAASTSFTDKHAVVVFPNGVYLHGGATTETLLINEYSPHIALGFAFLNPPGWTKNPYSCAHQRYPRKRAVLSHGDFCSYIHCAHVASDTAEIQQRQVPKMINADPLFETEKGQRQLKLNLRQNFTDVTVESLNEIMRATPE
jgi:hypothetical protein